MRAARPAGEGAAAAINRFFSQACLSSPQSQRRAENSPAVPENPVFPPVGPGRQESP